MHVETKFFLSPFEMQNTYFQKEASACCPAPGNENRDEK